MPTDDRPLRADAQRNRDALVAAAERVMGRRGLDAPLDEIAMAAGVGNATLYRHFPTRRDLVQAVFAEQMARYAAAVERALGRLHQRRAEVAVVVRARDGGHGAPGYRAM